MDNVIFENIFSENKIKEWDEYKNNIIKNLNNINYNEFSVHITKPDMRYLLYKYITLNNNIFRKIKYEEYEFINENFKSIDIINFIEECIKIIFNKIYTINNICYKY
jgi:hypothetical protein